MTELLKENLKTKYCSKLLRPGGTFLIKLLSAQGVKITALLNAGHKILN